MDPNIIDIITKLGSGSWVVILSLVIYIFFNIYADFKKSQQNRIDDAKKLNEIILGQKDKDNLTFNKLADTIEKLSVVDAHSTELLTSKIENLSDDLKDLKTDLNHIKDKL